MTTVHGASRSFAARLVRAHAPLPVVPVHASSRRRGGRKPRVAAFAVFGADFVTIRQSRIVIGVFFVDLIAQWLRSWHVTPYVGVRRVGARRLPFTPMVCWARGHGILRARPALQIVRVNEARNVNLGYTARARGIAVLFWRPYPCPLCRVPARFVRFVRRLLAALCLLCVLC